MLHPYGVFSYEKSVLVNLGYSVNKTDGFPWCSGVFNEYTNSDNNGHKIHES